MKLLLTLCLILSLATVAGCEDEKAKPAAQTPAAAPAPAPAAAPAPAPAPAAAPAPAPAPAAAAKALALAVVDEDRVYEESLIGQQAVKQLNEMNARLQMELKAWQDAKKDNATDADAEIFKKAASAYQGMMKDAQQQAFTQLQKIFAETLANYRQKQGLEMILNKDNVLSYGLEQDVTERIIEAMNANVVDVKLPELKPENNLFPKK